MTPGRENLLLELIRREGEACVGFVEGVDRETYLGNGLPQHANAMAVIVIGQAASDLQ